MKSVHLNRFMRDVWQTAPESVRLLTPSVWRLIDPSLKILYQDLDENVLTPRGQIKAVTEESSICHLCSANVLVKNSKAHHRGPCLQAQMKNLEKEIEKLKGKIRGKQKKIRSLDRKWEKNTYRLRHQLEHMKKDIRKQVTKTAMVKFRRVVRMDEVIEIADLIEVDLQEQVPE